jgi:hypothetical protein
MKKVDMSEKAILKRLNQTEQLREVSLFLMKAKKLRDEKQNENNEQPNQNDEAPKNIKSR